MQTLWARWGAEGACTEAWHTGSQHSSTTLGSAACIVHTPALALSVHTPGLLLPGAQVVPLRSFSQQEIAQFDGSDPGQPMYLSIKGVVYDITTGKSFYGPNGGCEAEHLPAWCRTMRAAALGADGGSCCTAMLSP